MLSRHLSPLLLDALSDTRVVVILGARQVGKSTLVEHIAATEMGATILTLDDQATRTNALADPTGFVAGILPPVVIDEIQRVPDLLLAIKARVDRDPTPGQFLLTGSANLLTAPTIADALTGRTEYLHLSPFSQGELAGVRESFVTELFDGRWPQITTEQIGRGAFTARIAMGGFPAAVARADARRDRFFRGYLDTLLERDISTIADVHDHTNVRRVLAAVAATSGSLLNFDSLARDVGVAPNTVRSYLSLLDTLFLTVRFPPWHSNLLSRLIKRPKAYISDTGLLTHLLAGNAQRLTDDDHLAGMAFETFVAMEIRRQLSWHPDPPVPHHYRDRDGREVDILLEARDGSVVAIEVKSAASTAPRDFTGLKYLRDTLGDRFKSGVLLYTGPNTVPVGDRIAAVPLEGLWAG